MKIAIHYNPGHNFSPYWLQYCLMNNIPHKIVNCYDNDILQPIFDFLEKPTNDKSLADIVQECFWSIDTECKKSIEYKGSFECFEEDAAANEYGFLENGERYE